MAAQAALIHDPDRSGLWRRVLLPGGAVNAGAWRDAQARGELVGTCRTCGGYLKPGQPYRVLGTAREWFPAACTTGGCTYETAAPGPAPAKKSKTRRRPA